jgi:Asp-tRNA(Asn)/Glu-tRNA(Gln) amidotransferase C subunit
MSISQDELKKIAEKLSKIPGDNQALLWNITDIVGYMDLLWEVDTTWVIPTISVVEGNAILREDTVQNPTETTWRDLLASSKQKVVADQIVLPNIMN